MSFHIGSPFDVDRSTIVRGADAARQEGAVVIGVVPGKLALVAGVMPEADRELDRLDRLLLSATVLPSASTSLPPHDHKYGYHQFGASPKVWPAVWPGPGTRL
jgi:hypothetical protein